MISASPQSLGIDALRFGPAWYRTNPAPGRFDWSSIDDEWTGCAEVRHRGHRGPLSLRHPGWDRWVSRPVAADPSRGLRARVRPNRYPWVRHFTPVNEIFVAANFSSMLGWWNECATGDESFGRAAPEPEHGPRARG